MQLLGGENRKPFREIKSHLITEHGACPGAGAIATVTSSVHHMSEKIEILLHEGSAADSILTGI
jgi:hypothetical protein